MSRHGFWTSALLTTVLAACQSPLAQREPQSVKSSYRAWFSEARQKIAGPWTDSAACERDLRELNDTLAVATSKFFDVKPGSAEAKELFAQASELRKSVKRMMPAAADAGCRLQARRFLYLQRVSEETFLEQRVSDNLAGFPKSADLRNGDVLLMRGKTFFSATIANIPDGGAPYSHSALIHRSADGTVLVLESLAEKGVVITPFADYLKEQEKTPYSRFTVLRAANARVAARAADKMYARILADKKAKRSVLYDYFMDVDDRKEMFCTEMVKWAFEDVDDDDDEEHWHLPRSRSSIARVSRGTELFRKMGIKRSETFMPLDLEMDPRFEVVMEYRNGPAALAARRLDAVTGSMMDWMIDGYEMQPNYLRKIYLGVGFLLRDMGFLKETIPANVPKTFVDSLYGVEEITNLLRPVLEKSEARTLAEMRAVLADLRRKDCTEFRSEQMEMGQGGGGHAVLFHRQFHPKSPDCH